MSCNKGEISGLGRMVKEIAFCDGEQVQSIRLDAYASKGSSEEVSKALDVSLNQIDTYRYDVVIILIIGQTTDSGGGGVIETFPVNSKILFVLVSSVVSSTATCTPNLSHCRKVWSNYMVQVVLGRSLS